MNKRKGTLGRLFRGTGRVITAPIRAFKKIAPSKKKAAFAVTGAGIATSAICFVSGRAVEGVISAVVAVCSATYAAFTHEWKRHLASHPAVQSMAKHVKDSTDPLGLFVNLFVDCFKYMLEKGMIDHCVDGLKSDNPYAIETAAVEAVENGVFLVTATEQYGPEVGNKLNKVAKKHLCNQEIAKQTSVSTTDDGGTLLDEEDMSLVGADFPPMH